MFMVETGEGRTRPATLPGGDCDNHVEWHCLDSAVAVGASTGLFGSRF